MRDIDKRSEPDHLDVGDHNEKNVIYSDDWSHGRKRSGAVIVDGWDENPIPTICLQEFTAEIVRRYNLHEKLVKLARALAERKRYEAQNDCMIDQYFTDYGKQLNREAEEIEALLAQEEI